MEFQATTSTTLTFYWHVLLAAIAFIFFDHTIVDCWKMCPSINVFTRGFNTLVPHHTAGVKCIKGCPKITRDAGLVADVRIQVPRLHAHVGTSETH
jgi:hypothetical protein